MNEPLWIEPSKEIMDIPYLFDQLFELIIKNELPPSLMWLTKSNAPFIRLEYDEGSYFDWIFEFEHFTAYFGNYEIKCKVEVTKDDNDWAKAIELPYKWDKIKGLIIEQDLEEGGFFRSVELPLKPIEECCHISWYRGKSRGWVVLFTCWGFLTLNCESEYQEAQRIPYYLDDNNFLIVSTANKAQEACGWFDSVEIDDYEN